MFSISVKIGEVFTTESAKPIAFLVVFLNVGSQADSGVELRIAKNGFAGYWVFVYWHHAF